MYHQRGHGYGQRLKGDTENLFQLVNGLPETRERDESSRVESCRIVSPFMDSKDSVTSSTGFKLSARLDHSAKLQIKTK